MTGPAAVAAVAASAAATGRPDASSLLLRQDLVPILTGYLLVMGTLAIGLQLASRPPRGPAGPAGPATAGRPGPRGPQSRPGGPGRGRPGERSRPSRRGWLRFLSHLAGTAAGGYLLLMAVVVGYYYGIARVAGSFVASAVTGCALLLGVSLPLFAAVSWLTARWGRPAREQKTAPSAQR